MSFTCEKTLQKDPREAGMQEERVLQTSLSKLESRLGKTGLKQIKR